MTDLNTKTTSNKVIAMYTPAVKISGLTALNAVGENNVFPASNSSGQPLTGKVTLRDLRASLFFESAFDSIALGIAGTNINDIFFVFTNAIKHTVLGYVNINGSDATALVNDDGDQITYTTYSGLSHWERGMPSGQLDSVQGSLDTTPLNIWEYAEYVTDKPTDDPQTWDWSPALNKAIVDALKYRLLPNGSVYYAKQSIYFPAGYYEMRQPIDIDGATYNTGASVTLSPTFDIFGDGRGTIINSGVGNGVFLFTFKNLRFTLRDLTFGVVPGTVNPLLCKMGDETVTDGDACGHVVVSRLIISSFTKVFTLGCLYDSTFEDIHFLSLGNNSDGTIVSTTIDVLGRVNDNSNQILFKRCVWESSYQPNSYFLRGVCSSAAGRQHHTFTFVGCHFETARVGTPGTVPIFLQNVFNWNFYGCTIVQNSGLTGSTVRTLHLEGVKKCLFSACYIEDDNVISVAYDNTLDSTVHLIAGVNNVTFDNVYFKTAYSNVADNRNFNTALNYDTSTYLKRGFRLLNCTLNDFTFSSGSTRITMNPYANVGKQWEFTVDETTYNLCLGWANSPNSSLPVTNFMQFTTGGELQAQTVSGKQGVNVGSGYTTATNQYLGFYSKGDGTRTAFVKAAATNGALDITSNDVVGISSGTGKGINITADAGNNNVLFSVKTIAPAVTLASNVGSATNVWNNIFTQNAVTVVSDRNYKDFITEIPDDVLDVWGTVGFSQWKLNSAIAIKGPEDARFHVGIVAQDIKEAFEKAGMDATEYGFLIYESWDAQEEILETWPTQYQVTPATPNYYDEEGNLLQAAQPESSVVIEEAGVRVVQAAREAGEIWMVRMEECLAIEAAFQRRAIQKNTDEIELLKAALSGNS